MAAAAHLTERHGKRGGQVKKLPKSWSALRFRQEAYIMSAGAPKDAPPRQAIPKGLVIDTELVPPIPVPVVKQRNGKKASKKRAAETAEGTGICGDCH